LDKLNHEKGVYDMRVTKGRLRLADQHLVDKVFNGVKTKFGFIDRDIVYDMLRVLENKESIMKNPAIFAKTLAEYRDGKISSIFDAYYARTGYARFLKMMCESPHYPSNPDENQAFFAKMWELLAELWKHNLPQVNGIPNSGKALQTMGNALQLANQHKADQLAKLVEYGQKILELLKDPLFAGIFPPPGAATNVQSAGGDKQEEQDSESANGDSEDSGKNGDSGQSIPPQGQSSLDNVVRTVKNWQPYIVEAVLFSHDLALVNKMNPKGDWAPTPFPDNRIDIRKMQNSGDLMKLLPGEYALPSDLFYIRYAKKELQCREFIAKQERKQILYILLDHSGSMRSVSDAGCGYRNSPDKIKMAASVVIALLRKVVANGDIFYFRFFGSNPGYMYKVDSLISAQNLVSVIIREAYAGGGTDIECAVMTALNDIKAAVADKQSHSQMRDAQVLLLTDGDDNIIDANRVIAAKGKIKLHSVVIHATDRRGVIQAMSDTFYSIGPSKEKQGAVDIIQVVTDKRRNKDDV
jgi:hypothetical protein